MKDWKKTALIFGEAALAAVLWAKIPLPLPGELKSLTAVLIFLLAIFLRLGGAWPVVTLYIGIAGIFTGSVGMALLATTYSLATTYLTEKTERLVLTPAGALSFILETGIMIAAILWVAERIWDFVKPATAWLGALILIEPQEKIAYGAFIAVLFLAVIYGLEMVAFPFSDTIRSEAEARAFLAKHIPRKKGLWQILRETIIYTAPVIIWAVFAWLIGRL